MKNTLILSIVAAMVALVLVPLHGGTKTWTNGKGNSEFGHDDNWNPTGVPTCTDIAIIGPSGGYAAIGSHDTVATIIIRNGGRLVIQKNDNGRSLVVLGDFVVESGGTFNTRGNPGKHGPLVYIGGNIINNGTWNLSGVGEGVVLFGTSQVMSGTGTFTFENLSAPEGFTIDGTEVGYLGKYTGKPPTIINGGSFADHAPLPVQLASFNVFTVSADSVRLAWMTLSETNNYGFEIHRSKDMDMTTYTVVGFVPGHGTTLIPRQYSFSDHAIGTGPWYYRLRQIDLSGEESYSEILQVGGLTNVGSENIASGFALSTNYPNPFNPSTEIQFSVDATTRAALRVYNALGQEVATLFNGVADVGQRYSVRFDAKDLSSGTYFYRLEAGQKSQLRKMVLMR